MTALAAKGQPKTDQAETEQKNQARLSNAFDAGAMGHLLNSAAFRKGGFKTP